MELKQIIESLGIDASDSHHHSRTGWLQLRDCPFCYSHNFHLGIHVKRLYVNCYRCGRHELVDALSRLSGIKANRIADLIKKMDRGADIEPAESEKVRPHTLKLPKGLGPMEKQHINYLASRGFNPSRLTKLWNLQGLGLEAGTLAWRIFIPIFVNDKMVSWTSRSIKPDAAKRYHACPSDECLIPRNEILYGHDYVRHCAVLVEGPADVWAVGPGAVCSLGTSISAAQINMLSRFPIRVICLDSQPAAQKVAKEIVSLLEVFDGETYNVVLDAKDAGSASKKEIRHLRSHFRL